MTHYQTLQIERSASADEIKKAFRKLAHIHHPDKGGDEAEFKKINEAYQVLSDPQKKRFYDMGVNPMQRPMQPTNPFQGFQGGYTTRAGAGWAYISYTVHFN